MMTPHLQAELGERIDAAFDTIQNRVFRIGMSGHWHVKRASEFLIDRSRPPDGVDLEDESETQQYLDQLDSLIETTKQKDKQCGRLYLHESYDSEHRKLCTLFRRFRFTRNSYERLVRQTENPFLQEARRLVQSDDVNARAKLERRLRLSISEFIAMESEIAVALHELDAAREKIVAAHRDFAVNLAQRTGGSGDSVVAAAQFALRKASEYYDFKRGYSFEEYAQHWIVECVEQCVSM